jgi:hypothetical protein
MSCKKINKRGKLASEVIFEYFCNPESGDISSDEDFSIPLINENDSSSCSSEHTESSEEEEEISYANLQPVDFSNQPCCSSTLLRSASSMSFTESSQPSQQEDYSVYLMPHEGDFYCTDKADGPSFTSGSTDEITFEFAVPPVPPVPLSSPDVNSVFADQPTATSQKRNLRPTRTPLATAALAAKVAAAQQRPRRSQRVSGARISQAESVHEGAPLEAALIAQPPSFSRSTASSAPSEEAAATSQATANAGRTNLYGKGQNGQRGFCWSLEPPRCDFPSIDESLFFSKIAPHVLNSDKPEYFFSLFFTDDMLLDVVNFTNDKIDKEYIGVEHVCLLEVKSFIGLLLLFGVTKKRNVDINEIWCETSVHHSAYASAAMPRDRFKLISAMIRFDKEDNRKTLELTEPKFFKMHEIFERFRVNLKTSFIPGINTCVDETLYPYRGHCSFRQYMKSKPAKYGLKYNSVVDVDTSYCWDVMPYTGKPEKSAKNAKNVGETVVTDLVSPFYGSNRIVTMDNFFTSVNLARKLFENKIRMIGTVRKNKREIPVEFQPHKKKEVFSSQFVFNDYLTLVEYTRAYNKNVILLSTVHHDNSLIGSEGSKPKIIIDYNKNKGGVDTLDHLIENFTCRRRTNRWTVNCFFYMLDVAACNSFFLFLNNQLLAKNETRQRRFFFGKFGNQSDQAVNRKPS